MKAVVCALMLLAGLSMFDSLHRLSVCDALAFTAWRVAVSGRRVRWSVVALRSTIIPLVTFVGCVGALVLVVGFTL